MQRAERTELHWLRTGRDGPSRALCPPRGRPQEGHSSSWGGGGGERRRSLAACPGMPLAFLLLSEPQLRSAGSLAPAGCGSGRKSSQGLLQGRSTRLRVPAFQLRQPAGLPGSSPSLVPGCGSLQGHFGPRPATGFDPQDTWRPDCRWPRAQAVQVSSFLQLQ